MPALGRTRARTWVGRTLEGAALSLVFVAAGAGGVVLHANLPLARRIAARIAGQALSAALEGTVTFDSFSYVGLTHLAVPHVALLDAYSARVVTLTDVRADLSIRRIAQELLFDRVKPTILIDHLRVERADVTLIADPKTGEPTIARAIAPSPSTSAGSAGGLGNVGIRVYLPAIEIGLVTGHGQVGQQSGLEARVSRVQGLLLATPKGLAVDVKRFGMVVRGFGADARGTGTLAVRAPGPVRGTFEGFFGDVELKASAFLNGAHVEASVDVPRASADAASRLLPGWPLREAVSAHIDARGDLPLLETRASLRAGQSTIDVAGPVRLGQPQSASLTVKSRHLDARLLSLGVPPTDLSVDGTVAAHVENGRLVADATAHTDPTLIGGQVVPAMDVEASWKDDTASGTAHVHEPGIPLTTTFHATKAGVVDIDADTGNVNLSRLPRFPSASIAGTARARIRAHVEAGTIRASADADATGLSTADVRMERAHVTAQASGKVDALDKLSGTLRVAGTHASLAGMSADKVTVSAHGVRKRFEFDALATEEGGPELHAMGSASFLDRLRVQGTKISLHRDPVTIVGEIEELDPEAGSVDIRNVHVAGAGGTLAGSARLGRDLVEVEAEGENVDLDALGRALGLPRGTLAGRMRISASIVTGHDVTRGTLRLGLGNATFGAVGGLSAQVSADLDDAHLTGSASGLVPGIGTFGTTWDTELGGPAFESTSWRDITGHGEIQLGTLRLPLLTALLPQNGPVKRIGGEAFAKALLQRKTAKERLPSVFATVATRGLVVELRGNEAPNKVAGIDVTTTGTFDGSTGDSTGTTLAADTHGDLLSATGTIHLDVERLLREPRAALAQLLETPVEMVVSAPPRKLSDLPEPIRPTGLLGTVGGNVIIRGTLQKPALFVNVDGAGLATEGSAGGHPVDLHADGEYEWTSHALSARGTAGVSGHTIATAVLRGAVPGGSLENWTGQGTVDLEGMPIDLALGMARSGTTGTLFGHASIERNPGGGAITADLRLTGAAIEGTALGEGRLEITTSGNLVRANLDLSSETGTLEADTSAGVSFRSALPELETTAPVRAHVVAHELSAVVLSPLVRSVFSRVGGRIDANLTVSVEPHAGENGAPLTWSGGVEGSATLTDGSALIDLLGLDVRDLSGTVNARGQGKTTAISIQDVHGRVRSPKDNLFGSADLVLEGVRVVRGTGGLTTEDLPLLFRGASQGHVTGGAKLKLTREKSDMLVDVDVSTLTARLPQASSRNVLDLSDNDDVTVVQFARDDATASTALPWRLALHLGRDVRIERNDIDLGVTGTPVVDLGKAVDVDGSLDLAPGGRVPVFGKVFVIEHGRLIFDTGEPTNPRLDVSASWRAPNGTAVVFVDVTGTLKEAKITTRSDPPLPKAEVDALLLGGSSSDQTTSNDPNTSGSGAAAGAVALGTGVAALGVNELLSNNPVELRVDSTSESRPRYTAAVRVRQNLWFEASTYQQTDRSVGSSTDRSVYSGTVDYRFTPRWSLRTEAGTAGGAMDLLWQYRY